MTDIRLVDPEEIFAKVMSGSVPDNPYSWLDELRELSPIHKSEAYGGWFLTRYHDVAEALRSNAFHMAAAIYLAPQHPKYGESYWLQTLKTLFPFMLPDDHVRVRRIVSKALSPKNIEAARPLIERAADDAIDSVADLDEFDFHEAISMRVPGDVMFRMMGVPLEDMAQCLRWVEVQAAASEPVVTDEVLRAADVGVEEFAHYVFDLTERRRANQGDDMISRLIQAEEEEGKLSRDEFYGTCLSLITGGISLTQGLLSAGVVAVLQNPSALQALLADFSLVSAMTEETLRYQTPLQLAFSRIAIEDTTIGGQAIKKGEIVVGMIGAANYDPTVFEHPHEFRLDRPTTPTHLGLGAGVHFCVGAALGRAEGQYRVPPRL